MLPFTPNPKSLAILASCALPITQAGHLSKSLPKRQNPLISTVPAAATSEQLAVQPSFDFDTDSCYNSPAVDSSGKVNPGRDPCDEVDSPSQGCHERSFLENNNVYVRSRCNNGWCAHLYGYYFEVDASAPCFGHRHDWEHVVVWTEGSEAKYVAASAHGGYNVRAVGDVRMDDTHPKIVYHKDGASTHAMRFATEKDEPVENDLGQWFRGGLVDYNSFPSTGVRDAMMNNDWGKGKIDFSDARIKDALDKAKGDNDIPLDTGSDG